MKPRQKRAFAKKFCEMLDCSDCDMSPREKRRLKLSMFFNPAVRDAVIEQVEETYEGKDVGKVASVGLPLMFTGIDWENFDWEAAKDFWVEILKVVIEIIMVFV